MKTRLRLLSTDTRRVTTVSVRVVTEVSYYSLDPEISRILPNASNDLICELEARGLVTQTFSKTLNVSFSYKKQDKYSQLFSSSTIASKVCRYRSVAPFEKVFTVDFNY